MDQNKNKSAAKAGIGYTIGNYCIKGIGLITTPIFARLMTTSDFGIYNTFLAYESILYIFIGLTLHASLKSAKYKFFDQINEYSSSVILLPLIVFTTFSVVAIACKDTLSYHLGMKPAVVLLMILYSYCSGLMIFYQNRIALDYDYREYLRLSFFNVICNVLISVLLMLTVFEEERYLGRILGGTIAYLCLACYVWHSLCQRAKPSINLNYWKYALRISIPLIPHGLAQVLLLQFDRIMISRMIGSAEAGLYSFAYTIYSLVQITCASLETVFSPWAFKQLHQEKGKENVIRIGTCFMLLLAGIVTVVMLICPELIRLLGGNKYSEAVYCALPILLSGFFAMSYCIPAVLEYYREKTNYIAAGTVVAALLNAVLNFIFIPQYGYIAAAYTTLISYIAYFAIHVIISKRIGGFSIIRPKYFILAILFLFFSFVSSMVFVDHLAVRIISLIFLIVFGVHFIIKAFGRDEFQAIVLKFLAR